MVTVRRGRTSRGVRRRRAKLRDLAGDDGGVLPRRRRGGARPSRRSVLWRAVSRPPRARRLLLSNTTRMTATTTIFRARGRRRSFRETRLGEDGARDDGSARARAGARGCERALAWARGGLDMIAREMSVIDVGSSVKRAGVACFFGDEHRAMITTLASLKRDDGRFREGSSRGGAERDAGRVENRRLGRGGATRTPIGGKDETRGFEHATSAMTTRIFSGGPGRGSGSRKPPRWISRGRRRSSPSR